METVVYVKLKNRNIFAFTVDMLRDSMQKTAPFLKREESRFYLRPLAFSRETVTAS